MLERMHTELHETLQQMWDSPQKLHPKCPLASSIALDVQIPPVTEAAALATLRACRACKALSHSELTALLHASTRRLLPRYTSCTAEGATAEFCFVVLNGQLEVLHSRSERAELNKQLLQKIKPAVDGTVARAPTTSPFGAVASVAKQADLFGEEGLLMPNPRERTVMSLGPVELLAVSQASLEKLKHPSSCAKYQIQGAATVNKFKRGVESSYIERALTTLPFFSTLPRLTQENLSGLLSVRFLALGESCASQGEPADAIFIVLTGRLEHWCVCAARKLGLTPPIHSLSQHLSRRARDRLPRTRSCRFAPQHSGACAHSCDCAHSCACRPFVPTSAASCAERPLARASPLASAQAQAQAVAQPRPRSPPGQPSSDELERALADDGDARAQGEPAEYARLGRVRQRGR